MSTELIHRLKALECTEFSDSSLFRCCHDLDSNVIVSKLQATIEISGLNEKYIKASATILSKNLIKTPKMQPC